MSNPIEEQISPGPWRLRMDGRTATVIDRNYDPVARCYKGDVDGRAIAQLPTLRDLCGRCLMALHEDDYPLLREELRQALNVTANK